MNDRVRRVDKTRAVVALALLVGVIGVVSYLLVSSRAENPSARADEATAKLLQPAPLQFAPYQYVAHSGSLEKTRQETGVDKFFAAFVLGDGTCTPAWGGAKANGLNGQRSAQIAADISAVRAAGGEVAVSFGGASGSELATVCRNAGELTAAYQSVITKYGLKRVDFDIEGAALQDKAANARRSEAIVNVQRAQPELQVWVTLPVEGKGLTAASLALLEQLRDQEVVLHGINIMTMNYNMNNAHLGVQVIDTTNAVFNQVKALYPGAQDDVVWRTLTITVMIGLNDTAPETLTLSDAQEVRRYASSRAIGTVSMWSVERDTPCPPETDTSVASPTCSGVEQQPYDFLHALRLAM